MFIANKRRNKNMKKIDIEELKKLNFNDGEKLLLANGYEQSDAARDDELYDKSDCDYIRDTYYCLYDEELEELDRISYVEFCRITGDPSDPDNYCCGAYDEVVKSYWARLE
jgi:hypothetical protein